MRAASRRLLPLLLWGAAACGADTAMSGEKTWLLGTWSSRGAGAVLDDCSVRHLEFLSDGTLLDGGIGCLSARMPVELADEAFTWDDLGEEEVTVDRGDGHEDAWRVTPGEDCNSLMVQPMHGDEPLGGPQTYHRGAVCVRVLPMCPEGQGECPSYESKWCDAPASACEAP